MKIKLRTEARNFLYVFITTPKVSFLNHRFTIMNLRQPQLSIASKLLRNFCYKDEPNGAQAFTDVVAECLGFKFSKKMLYSDSFVQDDCMIFKLNVYLN